jgi:bacterioferritin (cytochrome b1)
VQESTDSTRLGRNRTGLQMSPHHSKQLQEIVDTTPTDPQDAAALAEFRREYIMEADRLGSVPPPATLRGMAKSGVEMLTGNRPQAFIDKLAERLAFERGGTRLYDAVITKFDAYGSELQNVSANDLLAIRNEEAEHALLIQGCIEELGGDPTAQTPCADLVGVETSGLLQAVTDPRTTLAQTLHAALAAELVDNDGWATLIRMAEDMGHAKMAERFRECLRQEEEHLTNVRRWYNTLALETGNLVS